MIELKNCKDLDKIKVLFLDFDGVFTDNSVLLNEHGENLLNVRDTMV